MDKDLSDSDCQTSQDTDSEQSLVNKLKKNVTEIISNTPLSKWFRKQNETPTAVRRRQDDSDDDDADFHEFQPPTKRTKLPPTKETLSLNVSEVLSPIASVNNTKKPLYRNFPEPIAGPSGYQTRKMLNSTSFTSETNSKSVKRFSETTENVFKNPRVLNSMSESANTVNKESQSDSEESTSGYSSGRIGSKEIISQESSKQTSPLENSPRKTRSLFQSTSSLLSDRSLTPNRNSSLSSRMPSFNPSAFGSSNFIDRTLSTKKILNSPFYNGHTIYGGASAYGRNSKRVPQDMRKVLRQSISIKPVNKNIEKGDLQLGKTARRILDTLEQYSSPIGDAKKIPVASKRFRSEGTLTRYVGANPYSVRESRNASNTDLQVPSVTDLLKMKIDQQKTRLQDSTEAVRQIATKSKSILNEESYQIPVQRENDRHTGKIKTKITNVRQRMQVDEVMPEVKLNPVALPIKELPKFDMVVPPPAQKPLVTSSASIMLNTSAKAIPLISKPLEQTNKTSKPAENVSKVKENAKVDSMSIDDKMEFNFSAPLVLAEYLKPLKALNNFKFSEPLVKRRRSIHPELDNQGNKAAEGIKLKKNNGENIANVFGSFEGNKGTDSVSLMDKFKPKEGTWECSVCMIRNQADKTKCAACETSRSSGVSSGKTSFNAPPSFPATGHTFGTPLADKFRAPSNTWECPTCMIRNKEDIIKCAACETKKPERAPLNSTPKDATPHKASALPPLSTFGDKFKTPANTWECPTCMIINKADVAQCAACETKKPGNVASTKTTSVAAPFSGSGETLKFTPPSSTWECSVCLIRNKNELTKCAACESAKPGAKSPISASFGGDFKKKNDEWECEVCMVRNKATTTKCQCCESLKPGSSFLSATASSSDSSRVSSFSFGIDKTTATSFTFGIPPSAQASQSTPKTNAGEIFGEKREKAEQKQTPPSFSFGVPASSSSGTESSETNKVTPSVTFGVPKVEDKEQSKSTPTFTFGTSSKSEGAEVSKVPPTFSFGTASKSQETKQVTPAPTFSFAATSATADKAKEDRGGEVRKVNPLLRASEKLPEKAAVAPSGFNFALPKAASPSVSSTTNNKPIETPRTTDESPNKRKKPASDLPDTPKIPMFTFKAPTTNGEVNKTSPFSKSSEGSKPVAPSSGGFSFTATKPTVPSSAIVTPTFGSTVSKADSSKPTGAMFKFGGSGSEPPKPTNGFNFGVSVPPFGAKEVTPTKPFAFASPASSAAANPAPSGTNPPPAFGATTAKTPMFQFGGTTENKSQTASPAFSFNAPSAENKPAPPQYSFGPTPAKAAAFGFGQGQSASAPTFSFVAPSNSKPDSSFGASSAPPNPFGPPGGKQPTVFGAASSQNSTPNGMFNFGSGAATNQKAGFSFGASSGSSEAPGAAASQGGFSFGSSNAAVPTATPGGFNFSAAAPSFDANAKPSFNFTGGAGITSFSAPPTQDGAAAPQRKIKRAIRRTVR